MAVSPASVPVTPRDVMLAGFAGIHSAQKLGPLEYVIKWDDSKVVPFI